ncbi:MAG: DUF3313 family protein [Steroidobacteraceae bacterium]
MNLFKCLLASPAALLFVSLTAIAADMPAATQDGLIRQTTRNVDEFYLRPGADFARYNRVMLAPVEVSFARYWEANHREVDARESLRIRSDMAKLVRDEFTRQLQRPDRKDGKSYPVVTSAGADVLDVRVSIIDLDIAAPDVGTPLRRAYVLSAGKGRLVAELRDSQTGALLARAVDSREAREYPDFQIANRVTNSSEARQIVGLWSRLLRRYLDTARDDNAPAKSNQPSTQRP